MDSTGRLIVRVYTSKAQIPVEGATVAVTGKGSGGKQKLWSLQKTDRSGEIRPVVVEAPARSESTQPGTDQPFALFDVWAEHPGFSTLLVEGVQVFAGVETYQGMEMDPLPEGDSSLNTTQLRHIPAQTL